MGLMKLAMYHRRQGFDVVFYKGDLNDFVVLEYVREVIPKLEKQFKSRKSWSEFYPEIKVFIKTGCILPESTLAFRLQKEIPEALSILEEYHRYYKTGAYFKEKRWDRVCVTTLFTFYWKITIDTIKFAKKIVKKPDQILVGGIMATVVAEEVKKAVGITPYRGCINEKSILGDKPIDEIIDSLPLDYSILDEIEYEYPETDAYYGYTTRGCVNHCAFCAVPLLEPDYKDYIPLQKRIQETREQFGEQRNLLLLDNNVFASQNFEKIIQEIRDSGFARDASYTPSNPMEIIIRQLKAGWNDRAYIRSGVRLLNAYFKTLKEKTQIEKIHEIFDKKKLWHDYTATKQGVLEACETFLEDFTKSLRKKTLKRYVDFNQGMDSRLATEERMKTLSTIAIRPLRIAFDHWKLRKEYVQSLYYAQAFGITQMSNYILYNFTDTPVELYRRLLLNIDLCDVLKVSIYSFPMKYHPIFDKQWFSNRDYLGEHWSRKEIRTVQAVLNSTKGKIGRGRTFFFAAFGRNEDEFYELMKMPEAFIIMRWDAVLEGLTQRWRDAYDALNEEERIIADSIIRTNVFEPDKWKKYSKSLKMLLDFYGYKKEKVPTGRESDKKKLIENFQSTCPTEPSEECFCLMEQIQKVKNAG